MEAISEAVRKARYNEAIIVSVTSEDRSDETREIVLVPHLDEENGGIAWKDLAKLPHFTNPDGLSTGTADVGVIRHLRTKRWVLPMLNDKRRNELYDAAIEAACQEAAFRFVKQGMSNVPIFHILDIGTGTGLLGMLAAKHGIAALKEKEDTCQTLMLNVTSIEMASAMARLARMNIAANDLQSVVQVIEGHSCEKILEHKAILCTSELLESGLLGEGLLPALRDAWHRHLHPNAVMVPQRARVYAQVLQGRNAIGKYRGPTVSSGGLRFSVAASEDVVLGAQGASTEDGILVPVHAEALFQSKFTNDSEDWSVHSLSDPTMVLDFDFARGKIPGPQGRRCTTSIVPTASGIAHGIIFWWELDLFEGLTYSTQPGKEAWQDHWQQCLFVFPSPHEECLQLVKGEPCELLSSHTDLRISFALRKDKANGNGPPVKRPKPSENNSTSRGYLISPERVLQLNDENRSMLLAEAISTVLYIKGRHAPILDVSDFSLCAMMAAVAGGTQVSSLESSSGGLPLLSAQVAQVGNELPLVEKCGKATFQILQTHAESLTVELLSGFPAVAVMAEPYYEILEGWHLQEALNYYYTVKSLKERDIISSNALSVPSYAAVMGCAIQMNAFESAYKACGDKKLGTRVRGFCHGLVNKLGDRYHRQDTSFPMWQYDCLRMTNSFELARISYEGLCSIENNGASTSAPFQTPGICHGLLCWVEYGLRIGKKKLSIRECEFQILTTDSRSHRQVVRKLPEPVTISKEDIGRANIICKTTFGGLGGDEDHAFELRVEQ